MLATSVLSHTPDNSYVVDGRPAAHGTDGMWSNFSPAIIVKLFKSALNTLKNEEKKNTPNLMCISF